MCKDGEGCHDGFGLVGGVCHMQVCMHEPDDFFWRHLLHVGGVDGDLIGFPELILRTKTIRSRVLCMGCIGGNIRSPYHGDGMDK